VPGFDRTRDAVVAAGAIIPAAAKVILVEGNYLLLTRPGWRELFPLFDLSIHLAVPEATLRARLMARWADLPAAEARRRTEANDLPNGRLLASENRAADLLVLG
jgi:pantothenate kinase